MQRIGTMIASNQFRVITITNLRFIHTGLYYLPASPLIGITAERPHAGPKLVGR